MLWFCPRGLSRRSPSLHVTNKMSRLVGQKKPAEIPPMLASEWFTRSKLDNILAPTIYPWPAGSRCLHGEIPAQSCCASVSTNHGGLGNRPSSYLIRNLLCNRVQASISFSTLTTMWFMQHFRAIHYAWMKQMKTTLRCSAPLKRRVLTTEIHSIGERFFPCLLKSILERSERNGKHGTYLLLLTCLWITSTCTKAIRSCLT